MKTPSKEKAITVLIKIAVVIGSLEIIDRAFKIIEWAVQMAQIYIYNQTPTL